MKAKKESPSEEMPDILIVEDSPTQAEQLKYILEKQGYKVSVANSGKQALAFLDKHNPKLVISDIIMPEMDGYELCKQIKSQANADEVPVILLTSLSDAEDVLEGLACGADNFITKPYSEDYLLSSIEQILANKKLRKGERVRIGVEILFAGKNRFITADQQQMLTLLISTYEAAVQKNKELAQTQENLRSLNERLEDIVKERTAALASSEQFLSNVIDQSPVSLWISDSEGTLIRLNQSCRELFGLKDEEVVGKYNLLKDNLVEEQGFMPLVENVFKKGEIARFTIDYDLPRVEHLKIDRATHRILDVVLSPIKDVHGKVTNAIVQHKDITELKQAEEEAKKLNEELDRKNKELEQIIYVTSHDLRSPLVNVQGFSKELGHSLTELAGYIQSADVSKETVKKISPILANDIPESMQYIQTSIIKMDVLLKGLLRLSRMGRASLIIEELDMNTLMTSVIDSLEFRIKEQGVKFDVEDLISCKGDKAQLNQVFTNLLDNALKYMDPRRGGTVKITSSKHATVSQYCIEDNGIGIAPEHQEIIFDIFHRLNPEQTVGEGLGLAIVRRILDRHNGKIWVESDEGKGSRFYVSIPSG